MCHYAWILLSIYGYFVCNYVCVPHTWLVPLEARRWYLRTWVWFLAPILSFSQLPNFRWEESNNLFWHSCTSALRWLYSHTDIQTCTTRTNANPNAISDILSNPFAAIGTFYLFAFFFFFFFETGQACTTTPSFVFFLRKGLGEEALSSKTIQSKLEAGRN